MTKKSCCPKGTVIERKQGHGAPRRSLFILGTGACQTSADSYLIRSKSPWANSSTSPPPTARKSAYVAEPAGQPQAPSSWCCRRFSASTPTSREVADGYAKDGYLAVAPSTFQRVKPGVDLGYTDADMQEGFGYKNAVEALPAPA